MKPMQPDEALGAVVGNSPLPRTQVQKKLWAYIHKNKLQDAKDKRMINADDKLKAVFGGKNQVTMFEMTKLVNKHLGLVHRPEVAGHCLTDEKGFSLPGEPLFSCTPVRVLARWRSASIFRTSSAMVSSPFPSLDTTA